MRFTCYLLPGNSTPPHNWGSGRVQTYHCLLDHWASFFTQKTWIKFFQGSITKNTSWQDFFFSTYHSWLHSWRSSWNQSINSLVHYIKEEDSQIRCIKQIHLSSWYLQLRGITAQSNRTSPAGTLILNVSPLVQALEGAQKRPNDRSDWRKTIQYSNRYCTNCRTIETNQNIVNDRTY